MIEIIPAIDIIGGECVRLTKGDYSMCKVYSKDPLDVAMRFEQAGIRRLHVVDLDGAKASSPVNLPVLERIASGTSLKVEFGGGIKSRDALSSVLDAGATYAICGSIAASSPEDFQQWLDEFGGRIILGADVRDGLISTHGWLRTSTLTAHGLIASFRGLRQAICTDISRDGMLQGVDTAFYTTLQAAFPDTDIIVSGGISCIGDIRAAEAAGLRGVIVGKAFYEGRITIEELADPCWRKE